MLLNRSELNGIKKGDVTVVFRRWRRPTVKTGGTLKTAVGLLAIEQVSRIRRSDITTREARAAGHDSRVELLARLDAREGDLYRIKVRFAGADPRIGLREEDDLDDATLATIIKKLDRLDAASRIGPWTRTVLLSIERRPHTPAAALAAHAGFEKEWLKANIRKLKNLGLTISHQPGYELSPRGIVVLKHLKAQTCE